MTSCDARPPLRTVLIDVGGVLVDEGELQPAWEAELRRALLAHGYQVSKAETDAAREKALALHIPSLTAAVLWEIVRPDLSVYHAVRNEVSLWFRAHARPYYRVAEGAKEMVTALQSRYRLGIAANQPSWAGDVLAEAGLLSYFEHKAMSDDLGLSKPDARFYIAVLSAMNAQPETTVMVGDRLDLDILPARRLGMRTVRVRAGVHAAQEPRWPEEMADRTVAGLAEVPAAIAALDAAG